MCSNVNCEHLITVSKLKNYAQIPLDYDAVNSPPPQSGETMDFMRTETGMKRIGLEDLPFFSNGLFLLWRQGAEVFPKLLRCLKPPSQFSGCQLGPNPYQRNFLRRYFSRHV